MRNYFMTTAMKILLTASVSLLLVELDSAAADSSTECKCKAELLFHDKEILVDDEHFPWKKQKDGTLRWEVSEEAQNCCHLDKPYLVPQQSSSEDIQEALDNKWLMMIGDSSVRILHEYLIGRWLGTMDHMPEDYEDRLTSCAPELNRTRCYSDSFHQGARVTFFHYGLDWDKTLLEKYFVSHVGAPDVVVAQHGYEERDRNDIRQTKKISSTIPGTISKALSSLLPMTGLYPGAYTHKKDMLKLWMTAYNDTYFVEADKKYEGSDLYDGSRVAKEMGFEMFDRKKLVNSDGGYESPTPINEVLEIELEILMTLVKNHQV